MNDRLFHGEVCEGDVVPKTWKTAFCMICGRECYAQAMVLFGSSAVPRSMCSRCAISARPADESPMVKLHEQRPGVNEAPLRLGCGLLLAALAFGGLLGWLFHWLMHLHRG